MTSLRRALEEATAGPRRIPGMEKPLPDYSVRLARRSGSSPRALEARLSDFRCSDDLCSRPRWERA
jgi:hypothetical protein